MRIFRSILVLLVAVSVPLQAQELRPVRDPGAALFVRPASHELATKAFEACADTLMRGHALLRASCEQYLQAFQAADPDEGLRSVDELGGYVARLVEVACPSGAVGRLARYHMSSQRVAYDWERQFEEGERCLYNNNTNRLILSLNCGNPIFSPRTMPVSLVADRPREYELPAIPPDTARMTVPKGTVLENERDTRVLNATEVLTTSNLTWVFSVKDTTSHQPAMVVEEKSGGFWRSDVWRYGRWLIGVAAVVGIYELLDEDGDVNQCAGFCAGDSQKPSDGGGPVNPPNIRFGIRFGFP